MENKLIPNSTQIPNVISDLIEPRIPEAEMRCLKYICRRTYGFHKEKDRISLTQFVKGIIGRDGERLDYGTGLSRPSVVEALRNLAGSCLVKVVKTTGGNYYEINLELFVDKGVEKVSDEVVKKVNQLRKLTRTSKEALPKQVKLLNLQKKGNKEKQSISNTPSAVALLRTYFTERCKALKGYEPEMSFAKEGQLLKEKLKRFSPDQLKQLIDQFLNSKVGEKLGFTLSICLSAPVINQWQNGTLEKEKKCYYAGDPVVEKNGKLYVIHDGEWLLFAGDKKDLIYK